MIYSIQFLRGLAAIMVIMAHIQHKGYQFNIDSLRWFNIGGGGVDIFFIISGFIMCYVTHNKRISFPSFLMDRIKRIMPTYWILSLVALGGYLIAPSLINSSGGETSILASFTLIPNGGKYLIQNGWTLSYEFLYYIIFAFFIAATENRNARYVGINLFITLLVFIGVLIKPESPFYLFITNNIIFEFALGIICFVFIKNIKTNKATSCIIIMISLSFLVVENTTALKPGPRAMHYGIPMMLLFIGIVGLEDLISRKKTILTKAVETLGNISYSLYLIHPFALVITAKALKSLQIKNGLLFTSAMLLTSIVAGLLFYLLVERPITKSNKKPIATTCNDKQ